LQLLIKKKKCYMKLSNLVLFNFRSWGVFWSFHKALNSWLVELD